MYALQNFKVTASASATALASNYLLSVALNYRAINDVACFTIEALLYPVTVDVPRDSSLGGYTLPPVI